MTPYEPLVAWLDSNTPGWFITSVLFIMLTTGLVLSIPVAGVTWALRKVVR